MSIGKGREELDFMRGKIQSLKQMFSKSVSLSYDLIPLDQQEYNKSMLQVFQSMKSLDPNQKDLSQQDQLILGKIEGKSSLTDFKPIVQSIVGEVNEDKLKIYIKQKTQQKNYGLTIKDKNCSIKQVKKIQSLKKYFDIKQISKRRKYNTLYRSYIKSLQKFFQLFDKIKPEQQTVQSIQKAFQQYQIFLKEQKKFQSHVKEMEAVANIVEKQSIPNDNAPANQQVKEVEENNNIQEKKQQKQQNQQKEQKNISVDNLNKTPKKNSKASKKLKKEQATNPDANQASDASKSKVLEEKQKTIKKQENKQRKLDFFVIKKNQNPKTIKKNTQAQSPSINNESENKLNDFEANENIKTSIWDNFEDQINQNLRPLNELRSQFRGFKMQNQQCPSDPYFINMVLVLSTIEYYDFLMKPDRQVNFTAPFSKIREVLYFQDQSQQFEGQSASGNVQEEQEEEQQLSEGNNTILDDDHLSFEELSSCESNEIDLKVEYGKGNRWVINDKSHTQDYDIDLASQFSMICLEIDILPLKLDEEQEKVQLVLTPENWRDIYKITHGNFGIKDNIIKEVSTILPNVSKNWIDTVLKEQSQKIGHQRFIKKDFIEELKQKISDIQQFLEKIKSERDQQLRKIRIQKHQQKDQKLQKDILECTGSKYIVNLLKQLKQKGYKQLRRKELMDFINERQGQQWDEIKKQMGTMSKPIIQMMKNMEQRANNIQCDEQIVVEDEQFNKNNQQQKKSEQNSKASTKEKQYIEQNIDPNKRRRKRTSKMMDMQINLQIKRDVLGKGTKRQGKLKNPSKKKVSTLKVQRNQEQQKEIQEEQKIQCQNQQIIEQNQKFIERINQQENKKQHLLNLEEPIIQQENMNHKQQNQFNALLIEQEVRQ